MSRYKKPTHRKSSLGVGPMVGIAVGVILVGVAAFALFYKSAQPKAALEVTGRPSLKVDRESIDLDNQKLGNTVQASFKLTNVGDQPLRFTETPYIEVVEGC